MVKVELTEKFLTDTGGWQVMQRARALRDMGGVISANYTPPILKGLVREAEKEYRAGLKIVSASNVENICSCRESREWGTVCAHSLALGLAIYAAQRSAAKTDHAISPKSPNSPRHESESKTSATDSQISLTSQTSLMTIFSVDGAGEPVRLHLILSPNFESAWEKNQIMAVAEIEVAGKRAPLNTLNAKKVYRCAQEDLAPLQKILELNDGQLAGMMILDREQILNLLKTLKKHPRVTFGKSKSVTVSELLNRYDSESEKILQSTLDKHETNDLTLEKEKSEFHLLLEGSLNNLNARLQCIYGKSIFTIGISLKHDAYKIRDLQKEEKAFQKLKLSGFANPHPTTGDMLLKGERQILAFFAKEYPKLCREWTVKLGSRFQNITDEIERIRPQIEINSSGENWFDLQVSLETPDHQRFTISEIQRLLQTGQNHIRLKNQKLVIFDSALLDTLENVLADCNPNQSQAGVYRIHKMHAGYLDAALSDGAEIEGGARWKEWAMAQRQMAALEPVPLGSLENVLRPYQKEGVYWMNFLAQNGLSGILADEMGLGKTVQTLTFLAHLKKTSAAARKPALIVAPTSLLQNWREEARKFTPELSLTVIEGEGRAAIFQKIAEYDLVITSYALLRRDSKKYSSLEFSTMILDEAQHIKNPETQNAKTARSLMAKHRFVLTGTPIENSIRDLWSIMHFLMPGYLGSRKDFQERYEKPLLKEDNESLNSLISKRIRPFFLRRMKKEVCADLPEKIEQVLYCDLSDEQTEVYQKLLEESRRKIHELAPNQAGNKSQSPQKSRMTILTALLRLRQTCCDLQLLGREITLNTKKQSAKTALLLELLEEAIDGGHRVLVFSQFVSMLSIIREQLDARQIAYSYLDGATKDRMAAVNRFQNSADVPVFLISLKAGGVGLNLTAADTVIHFDPWWNPAVEAQATDRAHRIGQQNVVTSYKLIARNTVEEKILRLQEKKRALIGAALESEEAFNTSLTMNEIESLLA